VVGAVRKTKATVKRRADVAAEERSRRMDGF
jgi:hypothetical protein